LSENTAPATRSKKENGESLCKISPWLSCVVSFLGMKSWFIFFFWRSFFEIRNVMSFPTDTVRRALENKKLLDRAKNSNYSIVYSWFSSSHSKSNLKVIDIHREQQQLEASVSSFRNHYSDIPIHLFTNLQNFSSNSMVIHRIDLPSPTSLEMTHSLLYG
jgi:hypothetical protein